MLYKMPDQKYHPEYIDKMLELMAKGSYKQKLAAYFKVSIKTFDNWLKEYTEFKEAYEIGHVSCFDWWMTEGKRRYMDEMNDKGFKYWHTMVRNIFGFDVPVEKGTTNNYQIGNINMLQYQTKTDRELMDILQQKVAKVRLIEAPKAIEIEEDGEEDDDSE